MPSAPPTAAARTADAIVHDLVSRRTELPAASIQPASRLLRDLHLNSIIVGELVAAAARELGVAPPSQVLDLADASVGEVARVLDDLRSAPQQVAAADASPRGVDTWCRAFKPEWIERTLRAPHLAAPSPGFTWWAARPRTLRVRSIDTSGLPGDGVSRLDRSAPQRALLLDAAHTVIDLRGTIDHSSSSNRCRIRGVCRTLHLEHPNVVTRVVDAQPGSHVIDYVRAELAAPAGHSGAATIRAAVGSNPVCRCSMTTPWRRTRCSPAIRCSSRRSGDRG
jgi:enediyne polyketide synthase